MRIAVLIIALCLTMIIGIQSLLVTIGAGLADNKETGGAGAIGVFMAFLFVLGAAFALKLPKVSMVIFAIAGALGLMAAAGSQFEDLQIWGFVSLALAVMSYFGSRELRKKEVPAGKVES